MIELEISSEIETKAMQETTEVTSSIEFDSTRLEELVANSVQKGLEKIMPILVQQVVKEMQEARGR